MRCRPSSRSKYGSAEHPAAPVRMINSTLGLVYVMGKHRINLAQAARQHKANAALPSCGKRPRAIHPLHRPGPATVFRARAGNANVPVHQNPGCNRYGWTSNSGASYQQLIGLNRPLRLQQAGHRMLSGIKRPQSTLAHSTEQLKADQRLQTALAPVFPGRSSALHPADGRCRLQVLE